MLLQWGSILINRKIIIVRRRNTKRIHREHCIVWKAIRENADTYLNRK